MNNNIETIINIRKDIIGELEAINQYQTHILSTTNEDAKSVWQSIMYEEEVHVGELFALLFSLSPTSKTNFYKGFEHKDSAKGQTISHRPFRY